MSSKESVVTSSKDKVSKSEKKEEKAVKSENVVKDEKSEQKSLKDEMTAEKIVESEQVLKSAVPSDKAEHKPADHEETTESVKIEERMPSVEGQNPVVAPVNGQATDTTAMKNPVDADVKMEDVVRTAEETPAA